MDAARIYRETLANLSMAIRNHKCPDGRASMLAFCQTYGFARPNLCQVLKGTSGHELSVGLYLRIASKLGLCPTPSDNAVSKSLSLREYLTIDHVAVQRTILSLEFS